MAPRDPYAWFAALEALADKARDEGAFDLARALEALAGAALRGHERIAANAIEYAPARE